MRPRAFHEAGLAGSEASSAQGRMRQGQVAPVLGNFSLYSAERWSLSDVSMAHSSVRYWTSQLLTEKQLTDSQSERMRTFHSVKVTPTMQE